VGRPLLVGRLGLRLLGPALNPTLMLSNEVVNGTAMTSKTSLTALE